MGALTDKRLSITLAAILFVSCLPLLITQIVKQSGSDDGQEWREAWLEWASIAWRYFQPGVGVNLDTGLHYGTKDWHGFSDWDLSVYILAIIDAEELGILSKEGVWGADYRIDKILDFLQTRELMEDRLPYWGYDAETGEVPSKYESRPTNPSDSGRLLIALDKLRKHRPDLSSAIDKIVSRCDYAEFANSKYFAADDIYAYYVSKGFQAFGFDVPYLKDLDELGGGEFVKVYGERIPRAWVTSEPLIHAFLELDPDPLYKEYAYRVYRAQKRRYEVTGKLTAFSEGSYFEPYYYIYEWMVTGGGETWVVDPEEADTPIVYTKVAFAFHAMFTSEYTKILVDSVSNLQTDEGFREGITEDGELLPFLTDKTNGMIISAALFAVTAPTIGDVGASPRSGAAGVVFTISADVSDPSGVSSVVAHVRKSDGTDIATVALTDHNGAYTGAWDSTDASAGIHRIDILATDTNGNLCEAENAAALWVIDITPPEIRPPILYPEEPTYEDSVMVRILISDPGGGVGRVVLSYNDGAGWLNVTMALSDGVYEAAIPGEPYGTTVQVKVYGGDASGNWAVSDAYSYTVADNTAPDLLNLTHTPLTPNYDESVTVAADVSEPTSASGIDVVVLSYWNGHVWVNSTMTLSDGLYKASVPGFPYGITVKYKVYARDEAGNWAVSIVHSYFVGDLTEPRVTAPSWKPTEPSSEDRVTITVDVRDRESGVEKVTLYYSTDGGATWKSETMTLSGRDTYRAAIGPFGAGVTAQFYVEASDKAGNRAVSDTFRFKAKLAAIWYALGAVVAIAPTVACALIWRRRRQARLNEKSGSG